MTGPDVAPTTDLLFVGHFGHPPNVDAVRFLVRDVLSREAAMGKKSFRSASETRCCITPGVYPLIPSRTTAPRTTRQGKTIARALCFRHTGTSNATSVGKKMAAPR